MQQTEANAMSMNNTFEQPKDNNRCDNHPDGYHLAATTTKQELDPVCCDDQDSRDCQEEVLSRPILVGYAFGPKKMSTMGVVMAEASKTMLSSISTTVLVEEDEEDMEAVSHDGEDDELGNDGLLCGVEDACHSHQDGRIPHNPQTPTIIKPTDECHRSATLSVHSSSREGYGTEMDVSPVPSAAALGGTPAANNNGWCSCTGRPSPPRRRRSRNQCHFQDDEGNVVFSLDSYHGGLNNIVRYLHSSCSSVDTNSTTTTLLTTGTTVTAVTATMNSAASATGGSTNNILGKRVGHHGQQQQRLRVSFVPLDPSMPLEGQHGAKMDIILHKLTEDILCLSKYSHRYPELVNSLGNQNSSQHYRDLPLDAQEAILRVHRLMRYHRNHPECSLVDDPAKVLTLMSRSDIAHALAGCLGGVTSTSGVPVASPKFVVWDPASFDETDTTTIDERTICIAQQLCHAKMSYPLIAKPLTAAGTKKSHQMTVLLNASSLEHVHDVPCLLQEYANHDAVLYKVYVLGNNVHVYQRPSLPNLPPLEEVTAGQDGPPSKNSGVGHTRRPSYVDFDSQRPYPRLSAFGVSEKFMQETTDLLATLTLTSASSLPLSTPSKPTTVPVTSDEVQPIVAALKLAFGLELFGFDILIASPRPDNCAAQSPQKQMLVVDVNYFPSYKEVNNFPALLAQYLTQRAIDSRRGQHKHNSN